MKKKILIAVLMVCMLCGCEKTIPKLENGTEAVVTFKDGSKISVDELYDKMKDAYATNTLINMIDTKILEGKYSDKKEDADKYVSDTVETVKGYYGFEKDSELLEMLNQYGYSDIDEYKKSLVLSYYRNQATEDYAKSQVKDSEINKYYKDEIVGDREVSHIQIIPEVKDNMTDDEKKEKEDAALEKAKEVVAKLKKGEKFETLAKEYSEDEATKEKGGSLGYINKGTYGSTEFDNEVYSLKVGSYSTTPVKTSKGYEIVYVTNEKEKKALDEVKEEIIETIAKENISKDATLAVSAQREYRKEAGVDIVDDEISSSYSKYMNSLTNQAMENNASN